MSRVPNTTRKDGIYHFRRAIPLDLRPVLLRSELCCSLRTCDAVVARNLTRTLYLRSQELFIVARNVQTLTESDLAALVQDFYATVLERENQLRLIGQTSLSEKERLARVAHYSRVLEQTRNDLATNNFASADMIAASMIKKHGWSAKLTELDVRLVQQAMLRAGCDLAEAVKARFEGNFTYVPKDMLLQVELNRASAQDTAQRDGHHSNAASGLSDRTDEAAPSFKTRAEDFRMSQVRLKVWEQQTALQARKTFELFEQLCGDRPLSGYVRADAVRFKDMLSELPASYGKSARYRHMSATDIIAESSSKDLARLTPRTVQRHLAALSALWAKAIERNEAPTNIFAGFKFSGSKKPQDQRAMWSEDDLTKLFNTPVWKGCHSKDRRSKAGNIIIRDEKFWLPLVALYSGMRQEEICQLHVEDVRVESDVWVFDINAKAPRQLKNTNAVRLVPIHEELKRMGFLDYVSEQRGAKERLVFSQLTPGGADMRLGHNFTKWFTRYRRDVGLYASGLDFHSLRHSATTFMQWGQVPAQIIDKLTGHATTGETARYTKNFQVKQLSDGINAISPKIDLSKLYKN